LITELGYDIRLGLMKMRSGQLTEGLAVEEAILAMAVAMTMARVRGTHKAVRKRPGMGWKHRMGRLKGRRQGRGEGRQQRMGLGRGTESVNKRYCYTNPSGR
jgi:hypothetical protein